jgi:hypothetical protein
MHRYAKSGFANLPRPLLKNAKHASNDDSISARTHACIPSTDDQSLKSMKNGRRIHAKNEYTVNHRQRISELAVAEN